MKKLPSPLVSCILICTLSNVSCYAQKKDIDCNCKIELQVDPRLHFTKKAGTAVYIHCEPTDPRDGVKVYPIDSMKYIVIRTGCMIDSGNIGGHIPLALSERTLENDIIMYFDFRSAKMNLSKLDAIVFKAPAYGNK